jgi:radical SAM superfamily enzyme YgiQ (UPF0313 family)
MKVILVYPNQTRESFISMARKHRYFNIKPRPFPMINLGMLYLYNAIKDICEVKYIDNNVHKLSTQDLTNWIINQEPDIAAFGGTITEWTEAKNVSAELQKKNIITVYGGSNATANPEKHVKYFDFVFRGWAEETLRQFILTYGEKYFWQKINGLCCNNIINKPNLNCDLHKLKYPARDQVDLNCYRRSQFGLPEPVDIVVASRGCPFACRFCSSKSIWDQKYLMRPVDDVLWEVKYMMEVFGTKTIHFREDNLTVNKNWLAELCKGLKELKVNWLCQSRVTAVDKETVLMMKDTGCKVICFGFESANDSTLEYINKGFTFGDICKLIQTMEECQMLYSGGFMVGVLNEGEKEISKTLAFTRTISKYPHSKIPRGAGRFVGWPMSETYKEIIDNDLVAFNWESGEQLIPHTYKLKANKVENCIARYW